MQAIGNAFDVHEVAPDVDTIDSKLKVLMLVHPKRLPRATLRGIYQFVLRGGRRSIRAICDAGARRRTDRATDALGLPAASMNAQDVITAGVLWYAL